MAEAMDRIAAIANRPDIETQDLLARSVQAWRRRGARVVGVLAENRRGGDATCSAGVLRDIASGRSFPIALDERPADTRCHLDAAGVRAAADGLLGQIAGADLVVLSKFGKLEAAGGGLWPVFSAALRADRPVLTTVSAKHIDALRAAVPALTWLEALDMQIEEWRRRISSEPAESIEPKGGRRLSDNSMLEQEPRASFRIRYPG